MTHGLSRVIVLDAHAAPTVYGGLIALLGDPGLPLRPIHVRLWCDDEDIFGGVSERHQSEQVLHGLTGMLFIVRWW